MKDSPPYSLFTTQQPPAILWDSEPSQVCSKLYGSLSPLEKSQSPEAKSGLLPQHQIIISRFGVGPEHLYILRFPGKSDVHPDLGPIRLYPRAKQLDWYIMCLMKEYVDKKWFELLQIRYSLWPLGFLFVFIQNSRLVGFFFQHYK